MANTKRIRIGSRVYWSGGHGTALPREATVTAIEVGCTGHSAKSIAWEKKELGCFTFSTGNWCFGSQIVSLL